eukprot:275947_1
MAKMDVFETKRESLSIVPMDIFPDYAERSEIEEQFTKVEALKEFYEVEIIGGVDNDAMNVNIYEHYGVKRGNELIWELYYEVAYYLDLVSGSSTSTIRTDDIIHNINQALLYNPNCMELIIFKGFIYRKSQRLDAAIAEYEIALSLCPKHLSFTSLLFGNGEEDHIKSTIKDIKGYQKTGYNNFVYMNQVYDPDWVDKYTSQLYCILL